jgi:hypothetical protein
MLRTFFWLLLLLNAALLALNSGYLDAYLPGGHEPQRQQQQLSPDKLRLLGTVDLQPPPLVLAQAEPAPAPSCVELGDFSDLDASRFETRVAALSLEQAMTRRRVVDSASYIVYIPSQGDKEGADRKAGELRRLEIKDFFVMQGEGELRFGISLGIFKTKTAAEAHLAELMKKGVRSARIGGRGAGSSKVAFMLRGVGEADLANVLKVAASISKVDRRDCAAF